jgi:hypothetical protein
VQYAENWSSHHKNIRGVKKSLFFLLLAGLFAVEASAAERVGNQLRSEVCLNGTWQLNVDGIDYLVSGYHLDKTLTRLS